MRRYISLLLVLSAVACLLTPLYASATVVSDNDMLDNESIIELGHYDAVTGTETFETISLEKLKKENQATKRRLGLSSEYTISGYSPIGSSGNNSALQIQEPASPRTIFGSDDQTTPVNVNSYPYSSVLYLYLCFDSNDDGVYDTWYNGSGFLAGYDVMVTCAHNFYTYVNGEYRWVDQCRIYTRQASPTRGSTYYLPKSWTYSTIYTDSIDARYDWLVASLFDPIGSSNGWFAIRNWNLDLAGVTATISGYPHETPAKRHYQYRTTGSLASYTYYRMSFNIDAEKGQSGCPVYVSGNQVIGILTGCGTQANWAARITENVYNIIERRFLAGEELYG